MKLSLVIIAFLLSFNSFGKVKYVNSPSLDTAVSPNVRECAAGGQTQVPIITWGGDEATILANGGVTTKTSSIFGKKNLNLKLVREDVFANQVKNYMSCKSPFLRGTLGMLNMATPVTEQDPRTKMVVVYQMTWSQGGDALVVKGNISKPKDLKGKTVALQAYGPHVDYLAKVLANSGLKMSDVKIKWLKDVTGTENTPMEAFYEKGVDAALVIIPDALTLTKGGGAEGSVKGAKVLMSTKTAGKIISDVYAVRSDYFKKNKNTIFKFVDGLIEGQEKLKAIYTNEKSDSKNFVANAKVFAKILMDSENAIEDVKGMYLDAKFVGYHGNIRFFTNKNEPRNFAKLNAEIQKSFKKIGLTSSNKKISKANWDYNNFRKGLASLPAPKKNKFNVAKVEQVISAMKENDTLGERSLYTKEIRFSPKQKNFKLSAYRQYFRELVDLISTNSGAILTVEGHSDPTGYLKKVKQNTDYKILRRFKRSAINLSIERANGVKQSFLKYAKNKGIDIDSSQITIVGYGISKPAYARYCSFDASSNSFVESGNKNDYPCPPKSSPEWKSNRRVEFRIIPVETESEVFIAL